MTEEHSMYIADWSAKNPDQAADSDNSNDRTLSQKNQIHLLKQSMNRQCRGKTAIYLTESKPVSPRTKYSKHHCSLCEQEKTTANLRLSSGL